jgi:hypothetical protein
MQFILIFNLLFILSLTPVLAYECPFGRVNDPYPGQCALYFDSDNNQICDYGQNLDNGIPGVNQAQAVEALPSATAVPIDYHITDIIFLFIIFQLTGISLIQYKKLKPTLWRKLNNYALLATFFLTIVTSLVYLGNLTGSWRTESIKIISWLHIESGFIMILFSLEHAVRRWRHFRIKPRPASGLRE